MSGLYWCLTAMELMNNPATDSDSGPTSGLDRIGILDFVARCQHPCGGFSAAEGHDPHLLYTLSAVQILVTLDGIQREGGVPDQHRVPIDVDAVVDYVSGLQTPAGSFQGDKWGEIDTRYDIS